MKAEQEKRNPNQDTLNEIVDQLPTSFNDSNFLPQDLFWASFDSLYKENVEFEANFETSEILNSNRKPAQKKKVIVISSLVIILGDWVGQDYWHDWQRKRRAEGENQSYDDSVPGVLNDEEQESVWF